MNKQSIFIFCSLAIVAGCSRQESQEVVAPTNAPPITVVAPAVEVSKSSLEVIAPLPPPAAVKSRPAPVVNHKPTIRITAMMKRGNENPRVGVVQDSTGDWRILRIGQSFKGYRVDEINYEGGSVLLDWNGYALELKLEGRVEKAVIAPSAKNDPPTVAKMVSNDDEYKPTSDETARGIDPNDAATWPPDYRGPAIERIASEMGDRSPTMNSYDIPPAKLFAETQDELQRGIDPNDPKTWPKGYRGPVIERMALEMGNTQNQSSPPFEIKPPDGTPEEIRQRFLDTYAPSNNSGSANVSIPSPQPQSGSESFPKIMTPPMK